MAETTCVIPRAFSVLRFSAAEMSASQRRGTTSVGGSGGGWCAEKRDVPEEGERA